MGRDFTINGATLVKVRGSSASAIANVQELGLSLDAIRISPRWVHNDMRVNDFGPEIPPDVQFQLAEVTIRMTLIHYDDAILTACIREAMAGGAEGTLVGAGTPMGGYNARFSANCHFISLNLTSPDLNKPWRFLASYIASPPMEYPLGTNVSAVPLTWRAIPYPNGLALPTTLGIQSAGTVLWDHNPD